MLVLKLSLHNSSLVTSGKNNTEPLSVMSNKVESSFIWNILIIKQDTVVLLPHSSRAHFNPELGLLVCVVFVYVLSVSVWFPSGSLISSSHPTTWQWIDWLHKIARKCEWVCIVSCGGQLCPIWGEFQSHSHWSLVKIQIHHDPDEDKAVTEDKSIKFAHAEYTLHSRALAQIWRLGWQYQNPFCFCVLHPFLYLFRKKMPKASHSTGRALKGSVCFRIRKGFN